MDEGCANDLPPPPGILVDPNVVERATHEPLHRVHDRRLAGDEFKPGLQMGGCCHIDRTVTLARRI